VLTVLPEFSHLIFSTLYAVCRQNSVLLVPHPLLWLRNRLPRLRRWVLRSESGESLRVLVSRFNVTRIPLAASSFHEAAWPGMVLVARAIHVGHPTNMT
jgi:hypothetical protein